MAISYIDFNGSTLPAGTAIVGADNRGLRYGDGLFETFKVAGDKIFLSDYHFERLVAGIDLLGFDRAQLPSNGEMTRSIFSLCKMNGHEKLARVRLMVFRGEGGIQDPGFRFPNYIIQSWPLPSWPLPAAGDSLTGINRMNEKGLEIDVFPGGQKSCDLYANLKSNNYLLYELAGFYAGQHGLDDCLVLNNHGRVADSSIANLFYCRQGNVYTPPLREGCIAGIMRRFLIETLLGAGYTVLEKETGLEELGEAGEVFLTNSIQEIRWVGRFRSAVYGHGMTDSIHRELVKRLG